MNCEPEYVLGNLLTQTVEEIYRGERRMRFLKRAEACRWGPELIQPFPRSARLDEIAKAIRTGTLGDEDIERIRQASLSSHRLLLD
jgi:hypothetical protein